MNKEELEHMSQKDMQLTMYGIFIAQRGLSGELSEFMAEVMVDMTPLNDYVEKVKRKEEDEEQ